MKKTLIVESHPETAEIFVQNQDIERLKAEWRDCCERERFAKAAIVNLAEQLNELDALIADATLRASSPISIVGGVAGIAESSARRRQAQDEAAALAEAKTELLKQLSKLESEFRGFSLEKSGIREGMFRLVFNNLVEKNKPLFVKLAAIGLQIGLTEQMIAGEIFFGSNYNLNELITELGIPS